MGLELNKPSLDDVNQCSAGRLSAKQAIRERIGRMRREADRLEALLGFIPDSLSPQADEALWSLAIHR